MFLKSCFYFSCFLFVFCLFFFNNLFYFHVGELTFGKNCRLSNLFYVYCKDINRNNCVRTCFFFYRSVLRVRESCTVFLVHCAILQQWSSYCWSIVPVTVEQSCQWLFKNHASHCWIILPVTVEELCQWLLKNRSSHCWSIVPVTVKQWCQQLLNIYVSDCWTIVPVTVEQSC